MRISALIPQQARRVLEHAVGSAHALRFETSAESAASTVRRRRCDAFVLDPALLDDLEFEELAPSLKQKAVPVILYASLSPDSARRILEVEELGAHDLVLQGKEDAAPLLERRLGALVSPSVPALLFNRVARFLHRFPGPLQTASVALYGSARVPRRVDELARSSGFARRTVDRWMQRAGVEGALMLLDTARLARVWEPVVEGGLTTTAVAQSCGYARVRLLVAHARRIVGLAPTEFATHLTREKFAERLAKKLLAR